jgi:hypothetical protein
VQRSEMKVIEAERDNLRLVEMLDKEKNDAVKR